MNFKPGQFVISRDDVTWNNIRFKGKIFQIREITLDTFSVKESFSVNVKNFPEIDIKRFYSKDFRLLSIIDVAKMKLNGKI